MDAKLIERLEEALQAFPRISHGPIDKSCYAQAFRNIAQLVRDAKPVETPRQSMAELAEKLEAWEHLQGKRIWHVASGDPYKVTSVTLRESDLQVLVHYTPVGSEFYNRVIFSRTVDEMAFGTRFTVRDT